MKVKEALNLWLRLNPEMEVTVTYPEQTKFKVYDFSLEKDGANFLATLLDWHDLEEPVRQSLQWDGDEKQVLVVIGFERFSGKPKVIQQRLFKDESPDFIASLPLPIPHLATRGLSDLIWEDVRWNEYRIVEYLNQTYVIWSK